MTTREQLLSTGLFVQVSGERTIYRVIERPDKKRDIFVDMVFDGLGELIDVRFSKSDKNSCHK